MAPPLCGPAWGFPHCLSFPSPLQMQLPGVAGHRLGGWSHGQHRGGGVSGRRCCSLAGVLPELGRAEGDHSQSCSEDPGPNHALLRNAQRVLAGPGWGCGRSQEALGAQDSWVQSPAQPLTSSKQLKEILWLLCLSFPVAPAPLCWGLGALGEEGVHAGCQ